MSGPASPVIEAAIAEDLPAVLVLQRLAYQSEARLYEDFLMPPLTETLAQLAGESVDGLILKATLEGRLIGSVRARMHDGRCAIGRLVVHPELQRRGVGRQLMRVIEARFPKAACFALFTGSRSGNLRLYQSLGYRPVGRRVVSPTLTLVDLEKQATPPAAAATSSPSDVR